MTRPVTARIWVMLLCLLTAPVYAIGVDEVRLPDPDQETRARELMKGFRCLVCENQSVEESNADLAKDIRMIVRERVALGDGDDAVQAYMVDRYGDWILMKPPFNARTLLLWIGPFLLVLIGGIGVWVFVRRQQHGTPEALTPAERKRLDMLLKDDTAEEREA
ncbi:MAG: cytochrome c-type biogenesis protein CcmH [Proteobacteria bacterium]|nr:cytochrome c-type biogenesis protein CcmH [Pseudomonadota bacterium]